jgi:hypothetical protein
MTIKGRYSGAVFARAPERRSPDHVPDSPDSGDKPSRARRTHSMTTNCKLGVTRSFGRLTGPTIHDSLVGFRSRRRRGSRQRGCGHATNAFSAEYSGYCKASAIFKLSQAVHVCALHLPRGQERSYWVDVVLSHQARLKSPRCRQIPPATQLYCLFLTWRS